MDGAELEFGDEAVRAVAKKAIEQKTGARGIRSIIENLMLGVMFDIPSTDGKKLVTVSADSVETGKVLVQDLDVKKIS